MSAFNKKTIYLHLGTYKTATTFIQHVLYHTFGDPGSLVYFPRVGNHGTAHHYLATNEFPGWTNGVTQDEYEKVWKQLLEDICRSDADCIVISSEMLCSLNPDRIRYIREMLKDYRIKAILYLRRQDQFISSLAAQLIKGCNGKPEYYTDLNRAIEFISASKRFDYKNMCANWAHVIGEENLIVRPFERAQFYEGNILADFFHHLLGISVPASVQLPPGNLNPRLCRDALEFKLLVNRMPLDRDTMNAALPGLLAYSESVDPMTKSDYQEHVLLSSSQRLEILHRYADTNAHIARTYLGREDGKLFEDPMIDTASEWIPYPGLDKKGIEAIIRFLDKFTPGIIEPLARAALKMNPKDQGMRRFAKALKHCTSKTEKSILPDFLRSLFKRIPH
jgi:hypothetical protein